MSVTVRDRERSPTPPVAPPLLTRTFAELSRKDVASVGGKAANLGELAAAGLPVPAGFAVTVDAYRLFLERSGVEAELRKRLDGLDVDEPAALREAADAIRSAIRGAAMPAEIRSAVADAYARLRDGDQDPFVAVRSSATAEDTDRFSFAGMFESFLNVRGADALLDAVKGCWASLFGERLLFYRAKQGVTEQVLVGVAVQRMVDSEKSGVMFTVDPALGDPRRLVIEAAFGLGEVVVGGVVEPDRYVVRKSDLSLIEKSIGRKAVMITRDPETGANRRSELGPDQAEARVLTDDEVRALAELGARAEQHYGVPQDIEWAIEGGDISLVQARPITTLHADAEVGRVLARGLGASPGAATGRIRVIATPADADRLAAGDILLTGSTSPDWVPIMRRAAAIITEAGGMTSHAAIVSRELGIPCIVGARGARSVLEEGQLVTVNARDGTVLDGKVELDGAAADGAGGARGARVAPTGAAGRLVTGTRIYVNLGEPARAQEVAAMHVDGVGLLRAEFMMLEALEGTHPRRFIEQGRGEEFVARMAEKLHVFAAAFQPRPVIYRTMDFRSNEFRGLAGGDAFEPDEANPMIGYRGCFRYTREPDLFSLELRAVAQVRSEFDNLHVMIPFVRTGWEFRECRSLIAASPLATDRDLQLWVMAEVPSVLWWLDEYAALGATGVSIGSNDLTQLVLGVDRDSEIVAPLFDERDRAVLAAIRAIISEARRLGMTCSICGQAPSVHADFAERLVDWGIDSISVNPDAIERTRANVAAAERRLLLRSARSRDEESGSARRPGEH